MKGFVLLVPTVLIVATVPAGAAINVTLTADAAVLAPGQQTIVRVFAQGTTAGLYALAGSITAAGDAGALEAVPGSFAWAVAFSALPEYSIPAVSGAPDANGGWAGFGSCQSQVPPDLAFAKAAPVEVAHYLVRGADAGLATLTFHSGEFGGFVIVENDMTQVPGTFTGVSIQVLPEPATLVLVSMAATTVLGVRRRR